MSLKLALEQTGLTWTLNPEPNGASYVVGTESNCNIRIPTNSTELSLSVEIEYIPDSDSWFVRQLSNDESSRENTTSIPIVGKTHIRLNDSLVLLAIPDITRDSNLFNASLITSTRLLCGSAHKRGLFGGFEMLNQLRVDPYKSKFPKSSIDVDQVTRNATQAILVTVIASIFVIFIAALQAMTIGFGEFSLDFSSPSTVLVAFLSLVSGFLIAFETIYLRWFLARKFLKKNYDPNFSIKSLESLSDYFRQDIYQAESNQNIVIFSSFSPFVGSGEPIPKSRWTVPIVRKTDYKFQDGANAESSNSYSSSSFVEIPIQDFYKSVDSEVDALELPKLEKLSQFFVDGFELDVDSKLLSSPVSRPTTLYLDNPLWNEDQYEPGSRLRAYRVYRYIDISRDYVLSHFLRFYSSGKITFVESAAYILPGIDRQRYSLVSTLDDTHVTRIIKMIFAGILLSATQLYIVLAVWYLGYFTYNVISWKFNDNKQRRASELQEEYNYGLEQTLREYVAEPLNLEENRKLHPNRFTSGEQSFLQNLNFRKILSNPILLIALFVLGPILLPIAIFLAVFTWFLNRYKETIKSFNTNLDYYGTQDLFMYWKAIQDAIFAGTIKLLKENNIDTQRLEGILAEIVNNSVTVNAGDITGSQISVGAGMSVSQSQKS